MECGIHSAGGEAGRSGAGAGEFQDAEGFVPRSSEGCLCSGLLLEMSELSRSAFSVSPGQRLSAASGGALSLSTRREHSFLRRVAGAAQQQAPVLPGVSVMGIPRGAAQAGSCALLSWNDFGTNNSHSACTFQAQLSRASLGIPPVREDTERKKCPSLRLVQVVSRKQLQPCKIIWEPKHCSKHWKGQKKSSSLNEPSLGVKS